MGPQHGLIGDDYGTSLPEVTVPDQDLSKERNMAQFSQSKEFQLLKKHMEERIALYQNYLPDGRPVTEMQPKSMENWIIANAIIGEFKAVIQAYETASEVVAKHVQRERA